MAEALITPIVRKKVFCETVSGSSLADLKTNLSTALSAIYSHVNRYDIFSINNTVDGGVFHAYIYYFQISQDLDQITDLPGFPIET